MKNKKNNLNLYQRQQLAEVIGNMAIAIFTIGALNPIFSQRIDKFVGLQLIASLIVAILIEVISLLILEKW